MDTTLSELEQQRTQLYAQLTAVGDLRRGSVNETYRRCGKPNCARPVTRWSSAARPAWTSERSQLHHGT